MNQIMKIVVMFNVFLLNSLGSLWAQQASEAETDMTNFSEKVINILKGPIVKVLGVVILVVGIASLLRGRHQIAITCFVGFTMVLFFPYLLSLLGH